ncbi:hypothetical protein ACFFU9_07850 [Mariniflexile ostreae]|uniref:Immunity protein 17 of polymorphic toxin system n=1 Tax=Mariniflexile ostreae TaxID=1520892 RepID=A0ABV5FBB4_9FLAO
MELVNNVIEFLKDLDWTRILSFAVIGLLIFGALYQRNWDINNNAKTTLPNKKKVSRRLTHTFLAFLFCIISVIISMLFI